jgi:hypothetical protein
MVISLQHGQYGSVFVPFPDLFTFSDLGTTSNDSSRLTQYAILSLTQRIYAIKCNNSKQWSSSTYINTLLRRSNRLSSIATRASHNVHPWTHRTGTLNKFTEAARLGLCISLCYTAMKVFFERTYVEHLPLARNFAASLMLKRRPLPRFLTCHSVRWHFVPQRCTTANNNTVHQLIHLQRRCLSSIWMIGTWWKVAAAESVHTHERTRRNVAGRCIHHIDRRR